MNKLELLEKLEDIRRGYLDYYNDHKPLVAEALNISITEDVEALDIDTLSQFQAHMQDIEANEYDDCYYISGMVHAITNLIMEVKKQ